jgi:HSP20 family protein
MSSNYVPLRDAMEQLFSGSFISPQLMSGQGGFPPANVHVTDDAVEIDMALAGAEPDDVTISVTGNTVTISGEVTREEHDTKGQTYVEEIWVGSFQRSFTLPFPIDVEQANASFENGMLKLTLPKSEAARPRNVRVGRRQRKIQGQQSGTQQDQQAQAQSQQDQQTQQPSDGGVQKERVPAGSGNTS